MDYVFPPLLKSSRVAAPPVSGAVNNQALLAQFIRVTCVKAALPLSTTDQIYRVFGGPVLIKLLVGTVTTIIASNPTMKVSSKALSDAAVALGTAVDIASTVDVSSSSAVGDFINVPGDGTALVLARAGAVFVNALGQWICPQGEIYVTDTASPAGAITWDLYYQPLTEGAYVQAVTAVTAAI